MPSTGSNITLSDVENLLKTNDFKSTLAPEMQKKVEEALQKPNCSCNNGLYLKILKDNKTEIQKRLPDKVINIEQVISSSQRKIEMTVINCNISELDDKLKALPRLPVMRQISMARWEDEITVILQQV